MRIYTRHGDRGTTSLASGQRVSKCCLRLDSYGTIDELNAHLGLLQSLLSSDHAERAALGQIQRMLFTIGGNLATQPQEGAPLNERLCVAQADIDALEARIDAMQQELPTLRSFILPAGCQAACQAHVCRTVCRRAERDILRLQEAGETVDAQVLAYVNRLSDYLFVLSRQLNVACGEGEVAW